MRPQIPVPSKGDSMRASWGASVANRVNELCAMAPANMLAREGFGGIGAQPLPQNLRNRHVPKYWSFRSVQAGGSETRSGEWYNCRLQVGYTEFPGDNDITGRDLCSDGVYYVEVDLKPSPASVEIKRAPDGNVPEIDVAQSLVRIPIGVVADGALVDGPINVIPVVYKYI